MTISPTRLKRSTATNNRLFEFREQTVEIVERQRPTPTVSMIHSSIGT